MVGVMFNWKAATKSFVTTLGLCIMVMLPLWGLDEWGDYLLANGYNGLRGLLLFMLPVVVMFAGVLAYVAGRERK